MVKLLRLQYFNAHFQYSRSSGWLYAMYGLKSDHMKIKFIFIVLCVTVFKLHAQVLTYTDFKKLVPALTQEDWKTAYKQSGELLASVKDDSTEIHAMVVYIHLYAGAGMVASKQMSYKKLRKEVMRYKGQKIVMAAHPITTKDGALNQTQLTCNDTACAAYSAAANKNGTTIFCFEKFTLKEKIQPEYFPARTVVRCGGQLENIELNPNESLIWIMRLTVTDAFVRALN